MCTCLNFLIAFCKKKSNLELLRVKKIVLVIQYHMSVVVYFLNVKGLYTLSEFIKDCIPQIYVCFICIPQNTCVSILY